MHDCPTPHGRDHEMSPTAKRGWKKLSTNQKIAVASIITSAGAAIIAALIVALVGLLRSNPSSQTPSANSSPTTQTSQSPVIPAAPARHIRQLPIGLTINAKVVLSAKDYCSWRF